MAWQKMKKSETYTFRMKPPVWDSIMDYEGNGRNEKLENLVHHAYFKREEIQKEIEELEEKRDRLKQEIQSYSEVTEKLRRVQWGVNDLLRLADGQQRNDNQIIKLPVTSKSPNEHKRNFL